MDTIFILNRQNLSVTETKVISETKTFIYVDYFHQKSLNKIRKDNFTIHCLDQIIRLDFKLDFYFYSSEETLKRYLGILKKDLIPYNNLINKFLKC